MAWVVIMIIGAVGFVIALFVAFAAPKESSYGSGPSPSAISGWVTGGFAVLLVFMTVFFSMTTVSPRAVGIQTGFGKYMNTLPAGFHWKAPWSGVEEFSTQVQTLKLDNDKTADSKNAGTSQVNYKGGGKGEVDATVAWQISDREAKKLWERYRSFEKVRDDLVASAARNAIRAVVGTKAPTDAQAGDQLDKITAEVKSRLATELSAYGVDVDSVRITGVRLDDNTQRSIEKVVAAQQDIERAKADRERARIDAETAKIRAESGALAQGGLQRYCLEITNSWDQGRNGPLPATWNCVGGSTNPVIVGQK